MIIIRDIDLSNIEIFAGLSNKVIEEIKKNCRIRRYNEGKILFFKGEKANSFYIVLKGEIKIIRTSDTGREKILKKMEKDDFFGEMGIIEEKERSATAVVNKNSTLIILDKERFLYLLKQYPEIALNMITDLSKRLRKADRDIENLAFFNVEMQLRNFLKERGLKLKGNDKYIIDENFTHQELANYLGTSRETVTRVFRKLEEKDIVSYEEDKIILKDDN